MMRSIAWLALLECSVPEAQMAGFGERHRRLHGLGVANFADQDHVRRLTQGILQRRLKRVSVECRPRAG